MGRGPIQQYAKLIADCHPLEAEGTVAVPVLEASMLETAFDDLPLQVLDDASATDFIPLVRQAQRVIAAESPTKTTRLGKITTHYYQHPAPEDEPDILHTSQSVLGEAGIMRAVSTSTFGPDTGAFTLWSSNARGHISVLSGWDANGSRAALRIGMDPPPALAAPANEAATPTSTVRTLEYEIQLSWSCIEALLGKGSATHAELALALSAAIYAASDDPDAEFGALEVQASDAAWYPLSFPNMHRAIWPKLPQGVTLDKKNIVIRAQRPADDVALSFPHYLMMSFGKMLGDGEGLDGVDLRVSRPSEAPALLPLPASVRRLWDFAKWDALTEGELSRAATSGEEAIMFTGINGDPWKVIFNPDPQEGWPELSACRVDLADALIQADTLSGADDLSDADKLRNIASLVDVASEADPLSDDSATLAVVHHQLGNFYSEAGESGLAIAHLERAWFLLRSYPAGTDKLNVAMGLAVLYAGSVETLPKARMFFDISRKMAIKLHQPLALAQVCMSLATLSSQDDDTAQTVVHAQEAFTALDAVALTSDEIREAVRSTFVSLYTILGDMYYWDLRLPALAAPYFIKKRNLLNQLEHPSVAYAEASVILVEVLTAAAKPAAALAVVEATEAYLEEHCDLADPEDPFLPAHRQLALAKPMVLLGLGDAAASIEAARKARQIFKEWVSAHHRRKHVSPDEKLIAHSSYFLSLQQLFIILSRTGDSSHNQRQLEEADRLRSELERSAQDIGRFVEDNPEPALQTVIAILGAINDWRLVAAGNTRLRGPEIHARLNAALTQWNLLARDEQPPWLPDLRTTLLDMQKAGIPVDPILLLTVTGQMGFDQGIEA